MSKASGTVIDVHVEKNPKNKPKKGLVKRLSQEKNTTTAEQSKEKQDNAEVRKMQLEQEKSFKAKSMGTAAVDYAQNNKEQGPIKKAEDLKNKSKEKQANAEVRKMQLEQEKSFKAKSMGTAAVDYAQNNKEQGPIKKAEDLKNKSKEKQTTAEIRKMQVEKEKSFKAKTMGTAAVDQAKSKSGEAAVQNDKKKASKESLPASKTLAGGDYSLPSKDGVIDVDVGKKGTAKSKKGLIKRLSKQKAAATQDSVDQKAEDAAARKKKLDSEKVMPTDLEAAKARAEGPEAKAAKARGEIFSKKS